MDVYVTTICNGGLVNNNGITATTILMLSIVRERTGSDTCARTSVRATLVQTVRWVFRILFDIYLMQSV